MLKKLFLYSFLAKIVIGTVLGIIVAHFDISLSIVLSIMVSGIAPYEI